VRYIDLMGPARSPHGGGLATAIVVGASTVSVVAVSSGHPAVAEVVGGGLVTAVAARLAASLAHRVVEETEPALALRWDLLLVLSILAGLAGVAVMALALR